MSHPVRINDATTRNGNRGLEQSNLSSRQIHFHVSNYSRHPTVRSETYAASDGCRLTRFQKPRRRGSLPLSPLRCSLNHLNGVFIPQIPKTKLDGICLCCRGQFV